jgi:hypothetical protein
MDFSSGYKAKLWRIWAELLTIRQIAGHTALWRAAIYLAAKAPGGKAGLDKDPFVEAILAQDQVGAKLQNDLTAPIATKVRGGGRLRAEHDAHPQAPQRARHKERRGRPGLVHGIRGPSHPAHRRPLH